MLFAVGIKGSVHTTTAGMPCRSNVIPSCKLLDEQDPQSPIAVITTSQVLAISSTMSLGQGLETSCLDRRIT